MRTIALKNLGCKVNTCELDAIEEMFLARGYETVPFEEKADIYIINTCTVTNIADRKSRQMLTKARKKNPDALIVATGCYAQAAVDLGEALPEVDLVVGNNLKGQIADYIEAYEKGEMAVHAMNLSRETDFEELCLPTPHEHTRAAIKVQDGCNQFCTYCIIPFVRGRIRSRKIENVIREVSGLVKEGIKEIVVTGIHLSSYGRDLKEEITLLDLLKAIADVPGVKRIRLGSLEPGIVTETFARELAHIEAFCPHFHLSLQSGCTATLKRMNRKYTAEEFLEACRILRAVFDRPALTTDIITGFPGENEMEFSETVKFVKAVHFYETHIFPYSRRKGTLAAKMPDQVPMALKKERGNVLRAINAENKYAFENLFAGEEVEVLFEEEKERDGKKVIQGHTKRYLLVEADAEKYAPNDLKKVKLGQDAFIVH